MLLNYCVGEDSWESLGLQGDHISPSPKKSALNIHWKDWCWSWSSSPLATWCEELTHLKRPWCWERLKAGGEGDDKGWDDWMASPTQWTWIWVSSRSWWRTRKPGMLQSMGSQRVGHNCATERNFLAGTQPIKSHGLCLLQSSQLPLPLSKSTLFPLPCWDLPVDRYGLSSVAQSRPTLCPWNSPGKNTWVGCHFLHQGILLTQGLNPNLLHGEANPLLLSHL